jgi:hypothetical protein
MFWIVVGLLVLTAEAIARSDRPHIVFILADDVVSSNKNNYPTVEVNGLKGKSRSNVRLEKQRI